jgi:glyceraldehyde 3-phosphate dehydrogenase
MALKVAINGTGRIGLSVAKIVTNRDDMELVALNTTASMEMLVHLLKYDTVHIGADCSIIDDEYILLNGSKVRVFSDRDLNNVDFGGEGATAVFECTGKFLTTNTCQGYLKNGVQKVIMSAPAKDDTPMYVLNINTDSYKNEAIISNASCTTNGLAPITKVLDDAFGIENGLMTTIHSYTNDQNVLDVKHTKDFRRARAAALNMIPTTTGAAKAIGKIIPHLQGKFNGYAMRVPTADVSVVDLTVTLKKDVTKEDIDNAMIEASKSNFKGLLEVDMDKRVSSDFIGSTYSSTYVPDMTSVVNGNVAKVLAWYDNEWGYSSRLVDMAKFVREF